MFNNCFLINYFSTYLYLVSVWKRHENAAQKKGCSVLHSFKEKPIKWKPELQVPAESHTRCQEPRADPGLLPSAPCSFSLLLRHQMMEQDTQGGLELRWRAANESHTLNLPKCHSPHPRNFAWAVKERLGHNCFMVSCTKITIIPLQCVFMSWYDILKPKRSSRSSFNFNVFCPSNQNNFFFFNYL